MAKVLQIIDVDSEGHKVRLDDGRVILVPHGGEHPHIGQELTEESSDAVDSEPVAETQHESGHAEEAAPLG